MHMKMNGLVINQQEREKMKYMPFLLGIRQSPQQSQMGALEAQGWWYQSHFARCILEGLK